MKLNYINSIRGIAVLMVLLVHAGQALNYTNLFTNYGQMGVQLFFVASAFTLCLSSYNRAFEDNKIKKYAIRRYFRIAPPYYLAILVYFIISLIEYYNETGTLIIPEKYNLPNIISNITFTHGFYKPANNNIVSGGWSIGTEMAFYLIFPILFYLANKISLSKPKIFVAWIFTSLALSQLVILFIIKMTGANFINNSFLYYSLMNQFPVFSIGIVYYFLTLKNYLNHNWKLDFLAFATTTIISLYLWETNIGYMFTIIPFISGLSFLFLMEIFRKVTILSHPLLNKIGRVSYSMYLVHFIFVDHIFKFYVLKLNISSPLQVTLLYVLTIAGSFALSILSEKYIEKPFIDLGNKLIKKI